MEQSPQTPLEQHFYNEGEYGLDTNLLERLKGPAIKKLVEQRGPPSCNGCKESFGVIGTVKALYFSMPYMECRFCETPYVLSDYMKKDSNPKSSLH